MNLTKHLTIALVVVVISTGTIAGIVRADAGNSVPTAKSTPTVEPIEDLSENALSKEPYPLGPPTAAKVFSTGPAVLTFQFPAVPGDMRPVKVAYLTDSQHLKYPLASVITQFASCKNCKWTLTEVRTIYDCEGALKAAELYYKE